MNFYEHNNSEIYAIACLKLLINEKYSLLINLQSNKSPDWIGNEAFDCGVEVTLAINSNECKFYKWMIKTEGKSFTEKIDILKNKKVPAYLLNLGNIKVISHTKGYINHNEHLKKAKESIVKKLEKLNREHNPYSRFKSNELFVFLSFPLNKEDIEEIIRDLDFNKYETKFDIIYMYDFPEIFIFNYNSKKIESIPISDEMNKKIIMEYENMCKQKNLAQEARNLSAD